MGCDLGWADCLNQDFQDGRGFSGLLAIGQVLIEKSTKGHEVALREIGSTAGDGVVAVRRICFVV